MTFETYATIQIMYGYGGAILVDCAFVFDTVENIADKYGTTPPVPLIAISGEKVKSRKYVVQTFDGTKVKEQRRYFSQKKEWERFIKAWFLDYKEP